MLNTVLDDEEGKGKNAAGKNQAYLPGKLVKKPQ